MKSFVETWETHFWNICMQLIIVEKFLWNVGDTFLKHFNRNIWKGKFGGNICETFLKHLHETFINKSCWRNVSTTFLKHCLRNFCLHKFRGNISATFLKHFLNFQIEKKSFFYFQFFSLSLRMRDVPFRSYNPDKEKKKKLVYRPWTMMHLSRPPSDSNFEPSVYEADVLPSWPGRKKCQRSLDCSIHGTQINHKLQVPDRNKKIRLRSK